LSFEQALDREREGKDTSDEKALGLEEREHVEAKSS